MSATTTHTLSASIRLPRDLDEHTEPALLGILSKCPSIHRVQPEGENKALHVQWDDDLPTTRDFEAAIRELCLTDSILREGTLNQTVMVTYYPSGQPSYRIEVHICEKSS